MTAVVHYDGFLCDADAPNMRGQKFDSSRDRGTPFTFVPGAGTVIQGWEVGVPGMKVGGRRQLTIPPEMAYGDRGSAEVIPPNATLIFDIELIEVR
jgi:FKBP-type peptidyl-prolyl cis-trans isomerase FkpA